MLVRYEARSPATRIPPVGPFALSTWFLSWRHGHWLRRGPVCCTPPPLAANDLPEVTPELREQAVAVMRKTLDQEERWVKVHAAEYLIALDYPQEVVEVYLDELKQFEDEPQYRVGVWRVLARAAATDEQRRQWVENIRQVFLDTDATDRGHAAETLAKLKYNDSRRGRRAVPCGFHVRKHDPGDRRQLGSGQLGSRRKPSRGSARCWESDDPKARGYAAYALRHLPEVPNAIREKLAAAFKGEPVDSSARGHVVAAAATHAGPGDKQPIEALRKIAAEGKERDRYEACNTLAILGTAADLALLERLMAEDESADVRSTAGYAVSRIGRRRSHAPLATLDWIVIGAYVLGMLLVGWYYSRRTATTDDYLLGGRNMKPLSVGLSLFATLLSTITYLSWPGEMIKHGPMMQATLLAYPAVFLIAGWFMIPFIMKLRITSAYELLETRLGLSVRMLGSTFFLAMRLLWMAVIIFATTDKVLVPLLGLDPSATPYLCALLGAITLVYTSMGGLRAVVVTDVTQTLILFGGAILTVILITVRMGGVGSWWPSFAPSHWPAPEWINLTGRVSIIGAMVAQFTWWTCTAGSDQMAIQRYLATRDAKAARSVLLTSLLANVFVALILAAVGMALLAFFRANPHLMPDGQTILADADTLFPRFIARGMPVGISGLVVAGLLAAAMSSLSSGVNSSCSVITVDFIDRFRRNKESETDHVKLAKYVSVAVGVVVVALSSGVGMVEGNLLEVAFKVVNLLTAPLFGLFFMAMFVRFASGTGTLIGAAFGLAVVVTINYWKDFTGTQGISFLWAMPLSLIVQIAVGSVASLIFPTGKKSP